MTVRVATGQIHVRPLELADLDATAELTGAAFGIEIEEEANRRRWLGRLAHPLRTDPDGAFIAERDGRVLGAAQAIRRERLWVLSLLAVDPEAQSAGAGRALMDRALGYGAAGDAGLIVSSSDPRALRLYGLAGFSLWPAFEAVGSLDRAKLPEPIRPFVRPARTSSRSWPRSRVRCAALRTPPISPSHSAAAAACSATAIVASP